MGGETLEQVVQSRGGFPISGKIQGQVGWTSENLISLKMSLLTEGGMQIHDLSNLFQTILWIILSAATIVLLLDPRSLSYFPTPH